MNFTAATLRRTADRFESGLAAHGLALSFNKCLNLWSQIVVGKNYSEAVGHAQGRDFAAVPVTMERIVPLMAARSRPADRLLVSELLGNSLQHDLAELSLTMATLVDVVRGAEGSCVRSVGAELGLFKRNMPGHVQVTSFLQGREAEFAWILASRDVAADVINFLAGVGVAEADQIVTCTRGSSSGG